MAGIPEHELKQWFHTEILNQIPLNIAVIDKDFNIVEANENFLRTFGPWRNKRCFEVYKGKKEVCSSCEAKKTFQDGKVRIYEDDGTDAEGRRAHYVVHTAPVVAPDGTISHVLEMSENITENYRQQREYQILFERTPCYISVIDRNFRIVRANEKWREVFGSAQDRFCYSVYKKRESRCEDCPAMKSFYDGQEHVSDQIGYDKDGNERHYMVTTQTLLRGERAINSEYVMEIMTDITDIKRLEKEKLDAERLAAVGQTVAGLAHSVKNILMGIEGGMYMMQSGFSKGNEKRIESGWDILNRNIPKVSTLVKDFLSFAKGRLPNVQAIDPNALVDEIIMLYKETARNVGVNLIRKKRKKIKPANLDPDGIHTCLTNLVSNAIDACQTSNRMTKKVTMDVRDIGDILLFEVSDNGQGMDYDVKKKIFTTFFTTKAGKGTGLGLLTTRKIVQEHGGKIKVESEEGKGSTFFIELPWSRLPLLQADESE